MRPAPGSSTQGSDLVRPLWRAMRPASLTILRAMSLDVRLAAPEDAHAIATVHVASWQVGYAEIFDPEFLASLRVEERAARYTLGSDDPNVPCTQVAVEDGEIVGFVTTSPCRDEDQVDAGEIQALYVHPARWHRGIGQRLLACGTDHLRAQGFTTGVLWVLVDNEAATALYLAMGWRPDGAVRVEDPWGVTATVRRLVLDLA